jgi:hypothetical protein
LHQGTLLLSSLATGDRSFRHAGAGGARSWEINDRMSANICRDIATSAIWNVMERPWLTTFAPTLISFSRVDKNLTLGTRAGGPLGVDCGPSVSGRQSAAVGDGVDAPRRHLRAKVTASNRH